LDDILKSFNCVIKKGQFPYKAVNSNSLFFVGKKPAKILYNNISDQDYLAIPESNWDLKKETLSYLKSDVEGLLEVVLKFKENIYKKYNLNITKFKTLPGLALGIYTSKYFPNNFTPDLKMVKGGLEKKLRTSYYGGNVEVYVNEICKGYFYDMNSQYPKAMLNDMPEGNPVLSLEKDLNKIFGFIYGEISCPNESTLRVPFIQARDPIYSYVRCPRGKFKRLIFSEEIKYAIKYGYTIDIDYCYQFQRGKGLFTDFVNVHYEVKKKSNDPVQRNIAKLFLNSLYGRLGIIETGDTLEIVDKETLEKLDRNTYVSIIAELNNNNYLVKYSGLIDESITDLYNNNISLFNLNRISGNNKTSYLKKAELKKLGVNKTKTISSAVHIASAISSYARILINDYKNIPGNPCIMSGTDSAVLPCPLPTHLVGEDLGQMKLVHEIKKAIFIRQKLYYVLDFQNKETIKSSGIDSSQLSYDSFKSLLNGESVTIKRTNFNVE
jgi:hypothetical protein